MNFQYTEDQQLIEQGARDFAKEYLDPIAVQMDETGEFPRDVVKKMADHDFLGLNLSSEVGGAEAGFVTYVAVIEALSRSCAAVTSIMNHHAMASYAIQNWGNETLKKQYLPAMAKGEILGALAR
jgi:butyryl-CoA dehydrogenase